MSNLPEKFTIPKERIPKPWSQGLYNCCVAASITKVLEVINYVKTGTYIMFSKGYTYGRHSRPDKTQGGMDYTYAMESLLKYGTVPEEMFPEIDEIPCIIDKIINHPNIAELDKEAEKTKIKSFTKIKGNIHFYKNVKKCLYEHNMPLVGNMVGKRHCTVIVGWDGDKLLYHDHDGRDRVAKGRFNEAYYLDGGIDPSATPDGSAQDDECESVGGETTPPSTSLTPPLAGEAYDKEENEMSYKLMDVSEFKNYLNGLNVTRKIAVIQLHHTYSPAYAQFKGNNHIELQTGMRNYHVKTNGWADIAQQFTIFPDGKICTGRDINTAPAGCKGANSTGVCIECVGNFDKGGDTMTDAQKNAIVGAVKILLDKFGLTAKTGVTYHAWWTEGGASLGTYKAGRSCKTCPGTNFFGGNTREAYEKNLKPLIENYGKEVAKETVQGNKELLETPNDIAWELNFRYFPIEDDVAFVQALEKAQKDPELDSLYWGFYKLVNRIK